MATAESARKRATGVEGAAVKGKDNSLSSSNNSSSNSVSSGNSKGSISKSSNKRTTAGAGRLGGNASTEALGPIVVPPTLGLSTSSVFSM